MYKLKSTSKNNVCNKHSTQCVEEYLSCGHNFYNGENGQLLPNGKE